MASRRRRHLSSPAGAGVWAERAERAVLCSALRVAAVRRPHEDAEEWVSWFEALTQA